MFTSTNDELRGSAWQPAADLYRTPDGWLIKLDLAGVRPQDLDITLSGKCLRVSGTRRDRDADRSCSHYRMEITYSRFDRAIDLPDEPAQARILSEHKDGMLLIRILTEANT